MASCEKRRRVEIQHRDISGYSTQLVDALHTLFSPTDYTVKLKPLKIFGCNAADINRGYPFPKAYCCVVYPSTNHFMLADIFQRGLQILINCIEESVIPDTCSKQEKILLDKLFHYMEKGEVFPSLEHKSETECATLLANHLFGQLAASPYYTINKNWTHKVEPDQCICGKLDCKLTGGYGDTSIGNAEVWHGDLDIIVSNDEVGVEVVQDPQDTPGDNSPVEINLKSIDLSRNPQIIGKTIVFSFFQKQRHPERDHFLSPFIGVQGSDIVLMFYDSECDVLLESSRISLLDDETGTIDSLATVVLWLVVNHKYLCTGLTEEMKECKADFFSQAKTKLDVYENSLKFGDVGDTFRLSKQIDCKTTVSMSNFAFERFNKLHGLLCRVKGIICDEGPCTSKE